MKNETNLITSDRIDTLGALLADIKVLTAKADAIKDDLKDSANLSGDRTFEGDAFKALQCTLSPMSAPLTGSRLRKESRYFG
jgi:hypothetical protein